MPPPTPPPFCSGYDEGDAEVAGDPAGGSSSLRPITRLYLRDERPTATAAVGHVNGRYRIAGVLQIYLEADYATSYPSEVPQAFSVTVRFERARCAKYSALSPARPSTHEPLPDTRLGLPLARRDTYTCLCPSSDASSSHRSRHEAVASSSSPRRVQVPLPSTQCRRGRGRGGSLRLRAHPERFHGPARIQLSGVRALRAEWRRSRAR